MTRAEPPDTDEGTAPRELQTSVVLNRVHARRFATDCLEPDELGKVSAEQMYVAYNQWAVANDRLTIGMKALGTGLREIGIEPYRTNSERGYAGVRLKA